jgi:hypothetical protein
MSMIAIPQKRGTIMNALDFTFFTNKSSLEGQPFVTLQAEKGKRVLDTILLHSDTFSFIEGIIWYKHREYGNNQQSKINAIDWIRITEGFIETVNHLKTCSSPQEMLKLLHLPSHLDNDELENAYSLLPELIDFFTNLITWIRQHTPKKSHIMIIKQNE